MAGYRDRLMLQHIPRGSRTLDVGCGGGRPVLAGIGPTVGLEPIPELANLARSTYQEVAEHNAECMPFADDSFDAVVSTDILGHIPYSIKDQVLSEMFRVLRPGGITLHVAEVDSDGWMARVAKREPEVYQQVWIEDVDHRALEPPMEQLRRFQKAGFIVEQARPVMGLLPACGSIKRWLGRNNALPLWLRIWRAVDALLSRKEIIAEAANVLLLPFSLVNRLARLESGMCMIIQARKPDGKAVNSHAPHH